MSQPTPPLILIAEDDVATRLMFNEILKQDGYRVIETENGLQCLKAFKHLQPDLVLLDAKMSGMNGFICCQIIRSLSDHVPILMVTGLDSSDFSNHALLMGATSYLTKPVHAGVLRQCVFSLLEAQRSSKATV